MGQTSGSAPPLTPSEELKAKFDKSFPTKQSFSSITRSIGKPDPQQDHRERIKDVRKLHNNTAATGNSLAKDVARVEDKTFSLLYTMLDQYKLDEFMPDLIGSQSSRYNNAHRTFAIDSFQQACAGGGYRNFEVLQEYCNDNKTMARIYDSYVFGTLHERARKEARDPGYWVRRNDSNGVGKRKRAVSVTEFF
jgi:hypothetical protein